MIPYSCREACLEIRERNPHATILECKGYRGPTHSIHPALVQDGYDYHLVVLIQNHVIDPTAQQLNTRLHSPTRHMTIYELLTEWETVGIWRDE